MGDQEVLDLGDLIVSQVHRVGDAERERADLHRHFRIVLDRGLVLIGGVEKVGPRVGGVVILLESYMMPVTPESTGIM